MATTECANQGKRENTSFYAVLHLCIVASLYFCIVPPYLSQGRRKSIKRKWERMNIERGTSLSQLRLSTYLLSMVLTAVRNPLQLLIETLFDFSMLPWCYKGTRSTGLTNRYITGGSLH